MWSQSRLRLLIATRRSCDEGSMRIQTTDPLYTGNDDKHRHGSSDTYVFPVDGKQRELHMTAASWALGSLDAGRR